MIVSKFNFHTTKSGFVSFVFWSSNDFFFKLIDCMYVFCLLVKKNICFDVFKNISVFNLSFFSKLKDTDDLTLVLNNFWNVITN